MLSASSLKDSRRLPRCRLDAAVASAAVSGLGPNVPAPTPNSGRRLPPGVWRGSRLDLTAGSGRNRKAPATVIINPAHKRRRDRRRLSPRRKGDLP